ncbi:YafY family protein [Kitasatospora sp. NPDC085879]|uniref:helix-turn-helix transcriptional regulator n=1 Tax=Kitasatospora sp. NPDC085879 TaxID=3154769 RepID=UPI0034373D94
MSRPTGRVLTLLELLQSGGTRSAAELADRLGVEERTVRRYVDHLTDLGVPVRAVRGRYGGYRLAPGYRLPPLMLDDDEAIAVLLGLIAGGRPGGMTTAAETAAAKIRRVLPDRLARRLDALRETLAFTATASASPDPDADILLTLADAVRHRRPVAIRYTDRDGRHSERLVHAFGIVAHTGRWYVTGVDGATGEDRTFRLDRIADARTLPGSFEAPTEADDPAQRLLSRFAEAAYRHEVVVRVRGTVEQVRARFPVGMASVADATPGADAVAGDEGWLRVRLRVERLDWLPAVLASLDLPFAVEHPDELRELVGAFAERLAASARRV